MDKSEEILQHLDDIKEGVTKTNKLSRSQLKLVNEITRSIEAEEENEYNSRYYIWNSNRKNKNK